MNIAFEDRRLYVAPRKSVLFFARVSDRRLRCYVRHAALCEPGSAPHDEAEAYKHYLSAYDRDKDRIQAAARRLIEANVLEPDGAVIVSSVAIALEDTTKLVPTA
jgi:hypothetical protein